ncbi:MAG: hypothetical protein II128_03285, partial [Atopobiaceae bacterium]|nr:hypothetical protein [Atopobiaceae bacterium]
IAAAAALVAPAATPLISELLPLPAAIFTVVFQRWYPAHVARGVAAWAEAPSAPRPASGL